MSIEITCFAKILPFGNQKIKLILVVLTIFISGLYSCHTDKVKNQATSKKNEKKSRILNFEYGGYSDTIVALIYGIEMQELI